MPKSFQKSERGLGRKICPEGFGLPKKFRLKDRKIFRELFSSPNKLTTANFVLRYLENASNHPRLGIVLSKKKISKAADRNFWKRFCRETFRSHRPKLPNMDILIYFYGGEDRRTQGVQVREALGKAFRQLARMKIDGP